jgi:anaphase-promoting complex subunit 3
LVESIKSSLAFELHSNAVFLGERLLAQVDNEDVRMLLAEGYLGNGKTYKAYEVLKSCSEPTSRYKFALTCLKLNKLSEAERALLLDSNPVSSRGFPGGLQQNVQNVPNGAAGLYLLGKVRELQSKKKDAIKSYTKAL